MRLFTYLLVLTVITGFLSYNGVGTITETVKLTYACLALSTVVCALVGLSKRLSVQGRIPRANKDE
jgi:hypothetical protein